MKWVIVGLAAIVAIFFGLGYLADQSGNIDTRQSSVIPYTIGSILLVADFVLLVGFVIYKAFSS